MSAFDPKRTSGEITQGPRGLEKRSFCATDHMSVEATSFRPAQTVTSALASRMAVRLASPPMRAWSSMTLSMIPMAIPIRV